jgi:hypothetical protein
MDLRLNGASTAKASRVSLRWSSKGLLRFAKKAGLYGEPNQKPGDELFALGVAVTSSVFRLGVFAGSVCSH